MERSICHPLLMVQEPGRQGGFFAKGWAGWFLGFLLMAFFWWYGLPSAARSAEQASGAAVSAEGKGADPTRSDGPTEQAPAEKKPTGSPGNPSKEEKPASAEAKPAQTEKTPPQSFSSDSPTAAKEPPTPSTPPVSPQQIAQWIEQLGADSYEVREQATGALCRAGLAASEALKAALKHPDLEVRRRARWVLAEVLEADHRQRLEKFLADPTGSPDHPLPLWKQYRERIGFDEGARKLFAAMQRAEGPLLEAVENGGPGVPETIRARLHQIMQRMQIPTHVPYQPSLGTSVAFLFISGLPELELPLELMEANHIFNLIHQQAFQQLLTGPDNPEKEAVRRLLGQWILRPPSTQEVQIGMWHNRIQLALQHRLPEGLGLAVEMLRSKDQRKQNGYMYGMAVCVVGLLGGKTYAEHLVPLLEETQECTRIGINNKQITIEIRDVALAWLVHLTDQKHADYGMPEVAREFERLRAMPQYYPNFASFRYAEGANREESIRKFKAWLAANPLPKAPELPKRPVPPAKPAPEKPNQAQQAPVPAVAQARGARGPRANDPNRAASEAPKEQRKMFLPRADRLFVRNLAQAREAIQQGRFAEAARILGEILADSQDYAFQPDPGEPLYRTLKSEAARLLRQMPPEGLQTYQSLYEPRAKKALQEAAADSDPYRLLATAEKFFLTPSGAEAMYLAALAFLDRGQSVQAALVWQRLRNHPQGRQYEPMVSLLEAASWYRTGQLAEAETALAQLPPEWRGATVWLAGRQEKIFTQSADALTWLRTKWELPAMSALPEGWFFVHSNPAHNPAAEVGPPYLKPVAHWPSAQEPIVAEIAHQVRKKWFDDLQPVLAQWYPLVVGKKVIFYTATSLRAVDLQTGRLLWEAPMQDPLRLFLQPYRESRTKESPDEPSAAKPSEERSSSSIAGRILAKMLVRQFSVGGPRSSRPQPEDFDDINPSPEKLREVLREGIAERFWGESVFGLASSDGRRVYGLEDVPFRFPVQVQRVVVTADGRRRPEPFLQKNYNLLVAYDLHTGKALWEIGGPPDVEGMHLAGAYFLGPPIALGGRLYVVALIEEETRLLELASETGQVLNQLLLSAKQPEDRFSPAVLMAMGLPMERLGLNAWPVSLPAYAEGILVCRTAENHYVGVDLLSRTVRWIYEAAQEEEEGDEMGMPFGVPLVLRRAYAALKNQQNRWRGPGITIGQGYVVLTPPASHRLVCLRLTDGHRLWSVPRRDGLFVAGVADGQVVVVGRESVWAVRLEDGQPAWPSGTIALPPGATPTGQGYRHGPYYYLPLSSAELAVLDLQAGRLAARIRSPEKIIPGNLVACGQVILSQDVDGLYRWELLADRARHTADRLAQSPQDLQAVLDHAEVLLAQGQWQQTLELLTQAKDQSGPSAQDHPRFQQLLTAAVEDGFQADPAAFLKHISHIEALGKTTQLQTMLLSLLAQAYQHQGQIEAAFEKYLLMLQQASRTPDVQRRSTLHTVRQDRWIAARLAELYHQAPLELRAKLDAQMAPWKEKDRLEEFVRYFGFHPDVQKARIQLAQSSVESGRWAEAEWLLQTVLEQGDSDQQRLAAARLAELLRKAGRHDSAAEVYRLFVGPWADLPCADGKTGRQWFDALPADDPVRRALAEEFSWPAGPPKVEVLARPTPMRPRFSIRVNKSTSIGVPGSFYLNPLEHQLECLLPSGKKGETVNIVRPTIQGGINHNLYSYAQGRLRGHVLIAWLGDCVASVHLLNQPGQTLWVQPTVSPQLEHPFLPGIVLGGRQQHRRAGPFLADDPLSLVVTSHTVCFQQETKLLAVEPLAAEKSPPLWQRSDTPPNADLFGDEELLFVTPPGQQEATVLNILDGTQRGMRRVPEIKQRLAVLGRRILCWNTTANAAQAMLVDPWTEQTLWSRSFPAKSQPWMMPEGPLAVLAPSGHFVLVDPLTGQEVFHASLDPEPELDNLVVLASSRRYLVIANRPFQSTGPIIISRQIPDTVPIHGRITALDRQTGQPLWSTEVLQQNLRLGLPVELPVLVFYNISYQQEKNPQGNLISKVSDHLLCLDVRTGNVLHQSNKEGAGGFWYEVSADYDQRTISIGTARETVRLQFAPP